MSRLPMADTASGIYGRETEMTLVYFCARLLTEAKVSAELRSGSFLNKLVYAFCFNNSAYGFFLARLKMLLDKADNQQ